MLYRIRSRLQRWRFNHSIADILVTPPMPVVASDLAIVSMVASSDVPMYLLSMKAFYRRIGHGRLIAIVDRAMPAEQRVILEQHFPGITFEVLEDIDTGACQRGGTWERILYILDRSRSGYVVQVDSDTLPLTGDLQEIIDCIDAGVAFTMADDGNRILSLPEIATAAARDPEDNFVGTAAERAFARYPGGEALSYVRGSSGLAGFAPGAFPRARIEEFHGIMEGLVGRERWREWGTEQCASNFAVANSLHARVLPWPAYSSFGPGSAREGVKFFHFIGSWRFDEGVFAAYGRAEIAALLGSTERP